MAFGLTPKFQQEKSFEGMTQQQLLTLSSETINDFGWKISYISSSGLIAYTSSSMFSSNYEITVKVVNQVVQVKSVSLGTELFDLGRNKKNTARFIAKLEYLVERTPIEQVDEKYAELAPTIEVEEETDLLSQPPQTTKEKVMDFFSIFVPKEGFYVTPILMNINILVFLLMLINGAGFFIPDNQILIEWGANFKPLTVDGGQWWRIFTSTFIHAGFIHLFMNMYALLYIGVLLEPLIGRMRFAAFYVLTGLVASTTSLFWHDMNVCVGASGAIFGMYGLFLAMLTTNLIDKTARKVFLTSIGIFVFYNLVYGMKGNTDNAAHIGGLISGIALGYGAYYSLKMVTNMKFKVLTLTISSLLIFAGLSFAFQKFPKDFAKYEVYMNEFIRLENEALEVYRSQNQDSLTIVKNLDKGLDRWSKCNVLLDSIQKLDLPLEVRVRNTKLRTYIGMRIDSYQFYKDGHTDPYYPIDENTLNKKNMSIDSLIQTMK
ncbi:MAG: rhomboid family intramembrane serine protease [Bacteroidales bacterium]|nr:rhomboid family intramembrane serine protease [Bacteroidales bacterium]